MKASKKMGFGLVTIAALSAFATSAAAQLPTRPLTVMQLKENVYFTQGGVGGNTGIIVGQNGVIVVDAKQTVDSSKEVQAEIAKITPKPVTTAILTHSDGDHVNGLAGFPPGLTIIAQENCKKEMEASAGGRGAAPQDRLPTKTIAKDEKMTIEGVHFRLLYFAPAHTSGDLIIYLPDQKIAFAGDLLTSMGADPFLHVEKGGTAAGWIESVKGLVALDADTYVTGHGDLMTKDDAQKKLAGVQAKWDKIKALAAEGKSLDEVKTAMGDKPATAVPAGGPARPTFTEIIYKEVSGKG